MDGLRNGEGFRAVSAKYELLIERRDDRLIVKVRNLLADTTEWAATENSVEQARRRLTKYARRQDPAIEGELEWIRYQA